jgi:hypothetical protein
VIDRAGARTLIGVHIHILASRRLISFEINSQTTDFRRNQLAERQNINMPPPPHPPNSRSSTGLVAEHPFFLKWLLIKLMPILYTK